MRGPGFRPVTKLATCKKCGNQQLAWLKSAAGKWVLCDAYLVDNNQLWANLMAPHYKNCTGCQHNWCEVDAEPPYDVCNQCGAVRR